MTLNKKNFCCQKTSGQKRNYDNLEQNLEKFGVYNCAFIILCLKKTFS